MDVARDHPRITSDCEAVVEIPRDVLGFSHYDWSMVVTYALGFWRSSCNNILQERRMGATCMLGVSAKKLEGGQNQALLHRVAPPSDIR